MRLSRVRRPANLLFVGSLVLGGLIIAIGALAIQTSQVIERSSNAILAENVSSLKAAEELQIALLDQKGLAGSYLLEGDERWLQLLEDKRERFDEWLERAGDVARTEHEQATLQRISRLYQEYDRQRYRVIALTQQGQRLAAQQLLLGRVRELVDQLYEACEELLFYNEQLIAESQAQSARKLVWLQTALWSSICVAVLLGFLGGWVLSRGMAHRLVTSEKLASLGQMAGFVAHEVRNPLTAINLRLQSLQHDLGASAAAQEDVQVIRAEIDRLERLARDFLDLAKLPEPQRRPMALNQVVLDVLQVLAPSFKEQAVVVRTNLGDPSPSILADAGQIKQVLLNLLLNALRAMPSGGTVTVVTSGPDGLRGRIRQAEVSIRDTGGGISPELRGRIFEPFATANEAGTGLGLAIAKKIVEQHQGTITLKMHDGAGTEVTVRVPLAANGAGVA